jgi:hypothetical protein
MKAFGKGYTLNIYRRMPAVGDKLVGGNEILLPVYSIDLEGSTKDSIDEFIIFLEDTKLPLVSLETMLFKNNKILREPKKLIKYAVENILKQNDFFKYVEGRDKYSSRSKGPGKLKRHLFTDLLCIE